MLVLVPAPLENLLLQLGGLAGALAPAMPKKTAAAAKPAAGAVALACGNAGPAAIACGNAACRAALAPPLLQCSKCKAEAYCCKACQVGRGAPRHAQRAARAPTSARSPAAAPFRPSCRPLAARSLRGRPGTSISAARKGMARRRRSGALRGRRRRQMSRACQRGRLGMRNRTDWGGSWVAFTRQTTI